MTETSSPDLYTLTEGTQPLLVSIPHMGRHIPADIARNMTPVAQRYDDTDWHLDQLYQFVSELGASMLCATHSRYVIDLNRNPDGSNLYPGQNTTGLCPTDTFNEEPLYQTGHEPDESEKTRRRHAYWQPYHDALQREIERLHALHGYVLLWDAHSIRSHVPRFFEGRLPDFNFGTASNASTLPGLGDELSKIVTDDGQYTAVANGRFTGGYITRQYGDPARNIHAVQLELSQITYMAEVHPYTYDEQGAARVAPVIQRAMEHAFQRVSA